jgi:hypothetical protein
LRFRLGGGLVLSKLAEMGAYFFSGGYVDRARVGLLLGDASLGQIVDDRFGLDFQVTRELVDANLVWFRHS